MQLAYKNAISETFKWRQKNCFPTASLKGHGHNISCPANSHFFLTAIHPFSTFEDYLFFLGKHI